MSITHVFCCQRCGSIFESTGEPDFCGECRKVVYDPHKRRAYAVKKQCEVCGTDFISASNAVHICSDCRAVAKGKTCRRSKISKKNRTKPDIVAAVKLAQAEGLSYGEYMAKYWSGA